jgi:hypothetical protein
VVINKNVVPNESPVVTDALQLAVPVGLGTFCDALTDEKFATLAEAVMLIKQGTKLITLFVAELGVTTPIEDSFCNQPTNIKFHYLNIFDSQNLISFSDSQNQHNHDSP